MAAALLVTVVSAALLVALIGSVGPSGARLRAVTASTAPPEVLCHELAGSRCDQVAAAALGAVGGSMFGPIRSVDVWGSLLCGDTIDCPNGRLAFARVAGSAVIGLADGGTVWVNVTELGRGSFDAWVVRSRARG
ncbi:MAG TPA: hypothetical protein VFI69_10685 [Candidatus Limnocylindrales bacterium]|nr:hypothetical protein [Candidatus Limnocylindrales bacterium]